MSTIEEQQAAWDWLRDMGPEETEAFAKHAVALWNLANKLPPSVLRLYERKCVRCGQVPSGGDCECSMNYGLAPDLEEW